MCPGKISLDFCDVIFEVGSEKHKKANKLGCELSFVFLENKKF